MKNDVKNGAENTQIDARLCAKMLEQGGVDENGVVVVSRHDAFVEFLKSFGILHGNEKVISHVSSPDEIAGKIVISSGMPLWLSAMAKCMVVVSMDIPFQMRGKELSVDDMKRFFKRIDVFEVKHVYTFDMGKGDAHE